MSDKFYGADGTKGTVAVNNGSKNVTGTGTAWLTNGAVPTIGGYSIKMPDGEIYGIDACASDTALTLVDNYHGSNVSGGSYYIIPLEAAVVKLVEDVSRILNSGSYSQLAGLSGMVAGDLIQYVSGVWAKRTPSQALLSLFSNLGEEEVASSGTANIGAAASMKVFISGTTAITSLGSTPNALRIVRFGGALTLTHNGTSLILPTGANITTANGDAAVFTSDGSGNWRCRSYQRANGQPVATALSVASIAVTGKAEVGHEVKFTANGSLSAAGTMGRQSTTGMTIWGATGSGSDFHVYNAAGSGFVVTNPTGSNNLSLGGCLLFGVNTSAPSADAYIRRPADNNLSLGTSSGDAILIDSSRHVVIGGTSTGGYRFRAEVAGSQGTSLGLFRGTGTGANSIAINVVSTEGYSVAGTALHVGVSGATGRSLNAGGTLNASGADYADYYTKASACGPIIKGALAGINSDGLLTDKWVDAKCFKFKSTSPNLCGGDTWGSQEVLGMTIPVLPEMPSEPRAPDGLVPLTPPVAPDTLEERGEEENDAEFAVRSYITGRQVAQYESDLSAFAALTVAREESHAAAVASHQAATARYALDLAAYTVALVAYESAKAQVENALEAARQKVDRMACAGKVPAIISGTVFHAGDLVIPAQDGVGIKAVAVSLADADFPQFKTAVGKVLVAHPTVDQFKALLGPSFAVNPAWNAIVDVRA